MDAATMNSDAAEYLLVGLMSDKPEAPVGLAEVVAEIRPAWMAKAHCRGLPTALFFPEREGERDDSWQEICAGCPVHRECLAHALDAPRLSGVWGGTSANQRRRIRRQRRQGAA